MNPLIGSAFIGAGSSALGMIGQKKREKRTMANQQKLMGIQLGNQEALNRQAHKLGLEMWEKTNYPAQMKMLKEAGLNPALLYGQGGGGGATTSQPSGGGASGGNAPQPQPVLMGEAIKAATAASQIELAKSQAEKNKAEADKIKGVDTEEAESRIVFNLSNTKNKEANTALTKANERLTNIQADINEGSLNDQIDRYQWEAKRAMYDATNAAHSEYVNRETRENRIGIIQAQEATSVLAKGLMTAETSLTWEQARKAANDILVSNQMVEVAKKNATSQGLQANAAQRNSITNQNAAIWKTDRDTWERTQAELRTELQRRGVNQQNVKLLIDAIGSISYGAANLRSMR